MPPSRIQRRLTLAVLAAGLATVGAGLLVAPRSCGTSQAPLAARDAKPAPLPAAPAAREARGSGGETTPLPPPVIPGATAFAAETPPSTPEANTVHRMQAFTVAFDRQGLRLERAVTLDGRVKAPPRSSAAERLEFEAYDPSGNRVYQGSFDHPAHRHGEHFSPNGEITSVPLKPDQPEPITLRIPAHLPIARIDFFEQLGASRARVGSLNVP